MNVASAQFIFTFLVLPLVVEKVDVDTA